MFRTVADLAEAMQGDLGGEIGAYGEKELKASLEKCGDVGFVVEKVEAQGGVEHIGLRGVNRRWGSRGKVDVGRGVLYS